MRGEIESARTRIPLTQVGGCLRTGLIADGTSARRRRGSLGDGRRGHDIARRFNGPTEAFNHFAQNSNFDRGGYRALEKRWAREDRLGKKVFVDITPGYSRGSERPDPINVFFRIDGRPATRDFTNTSKAVGHDK